MVFIPKIYIHESLSPVMAYSNAIREYDILNMHETTHMIMLLIFQSWAIIMQFLFRVSLH